MRIVRCTLAHLPQSQDMRLHKAPMPKPELSLLGVCHVRNAADSGNRVIRKVSAATGIITTLVGLDKLPLAPFHVLAAPDNNVYFTDWNGGRIFKYDGASGSVTNVTVGGKDSQISGMAVNPVNNALYVLDDNTKASNKAVFTVSTSPLGSPSLVKKGLTGDLRTIAFNSSGDAYIGALDPSIYKLSSPSYNTYTAWNTGTSPATTGATATSVAFGNMTYGVAIDNAGNMLVSEQELCQVWLVEARTGNLRLVAGIEAGGLCGIALDPNNATQTQLAGPTAVAFGPGGSSVYIADPNGQRILKVELNCTVLIPSPSPAPGALNNVKLALKMQ
jgi:DNA-binding beta-propeller fold protein YncE